MIREIIFQRNFVQFAYRALLWHLKYWTGRGVSPLACGFYLTSKCNFLCEFCNIWRIRPGFQMPRDEARRLIRQLGKIGVAYFSFSGGEPLLVLYVFELLDYAKESGIPYTHMVSNGYLIDEDMAKRLAEVRLSEISFSLDADEKMHDKKRGVEGAFQKVIEAVGYMKSFAPRTRIVLNTILDPFHPENALAAIKTAENLEVKIKVQPLNEHPTFGAGDSAVRAKLVLNPEEKERLLNVLDKIERFPHVVNSRPFLKNYRHFIFCPKKLLFSQEDCIFGYHHIEVFANQLFPCLEGMNWEKGFDAFSKPLKDIMRSRTYQERLNSLRNCSGCKRNYYICYYEPRLNFPLWNFMKARLSH